MQCIEAFSHEFSKVMAARQQCLIDESVVACVREICADVRTNGDTAVCKYTAQFDGVELTPEMLRVPEESPPTLSDASTTAMAQAAENIRIYHERQRRHDWRMTMPNGSITGEIIRPVDRVGVYVPGGTAPLVSTVLMSVIPAQVAGVEEICVATPPAKDGSINEGIRAACALCGITEIYRMGGAQAIAALGYGTQTVPKVDVIAGPGNQYVTEAKRQLIGYVGIDVLAGPSETLVVFDDSVDPLWVATDVLSQAEHYNSTTYFVGLQSMQIDRVIAALNAAATTPALEKTLAKRCVALHARSREEAVRVANMIAPEHLQLMVVDADELVPHIHHAGAVFIGPYAPVPMGDFVAGPSHVLPTGLAARFMSGLSTDIFTKRMGVIEADAAAFARMADAIETLGAMEGLPFHTQTSTVRRTKGDASE